MRKIMVLQHVAHEPLGTLNPMLKAAGLNIRYVNFGRDPEIQPKLDGYHGLIVLGGPMGVYEADTYKHLRTELKLIEEAFKKDLPILGICLGSQLMAKTLGAEVRKGPTPEMGWMEIELTKEGKQDPLFKTYGPNEKVFQLHQDTFDIPKTAVHLAQSKLYPGQAFRYGDKAYALQFHLEVDPPMVDRWLKIEGNKALLAKNQDKYQAPTIQADTKSHMPRCHELSQQTFARFLDIFAIPERPERLGHDHGKPK